MISLLRLGEELWVHGDASVAMHAQGAIVVERGADLPQRSPGGAFRYVFPRIRRRARLCHQHRLLAERHLCQGVSFARNCMATFEEKLVEAVRRKRDAEGLSIRALATQIGVSFSTLARIERGDGQPDNNSKIRLLEWLGADATAAGLSFDSVAFVHFRANKNILSGTVQILLRAAVGLREAHALNAEPAAFPEAEDPNAIPRSKDELEEIAEKFRRDLGLGPRERLDSLRLEVDGVSVVKVSETDAIARKDAQRLRFQASDQWSAMSVPLDPANDRWVVLLNDEHRMERQRVTILEEYWHIFLGHKLTKVARIADAYGRTYDKAEEHDAYYLAAATLLPKMVVQDAVAKGKTSDDIGSEFGTSAELADYRIKRLGLWREHAGKQVKLSPRTP